MADQTCSFVMSWIISKIIAWYQRGNIKELLHAMTSRNYSKTFIDEIGRIIKTSVCVIMLSASAISFNLIWFNL